MAYQCLVALAHHRQGQRVARALQADVTAHDIERTRHLCHIASPAEHVALHRWQHVIGRKLLHVTALEDTQNEPTALDWQR
jgi:hypothetical protein